MERIERIADGFAETQAFLSGNVALAKSVVYAHGESPVNEGFKPLAHIASLFQSASGAGEVTGVGGDTSPLNIGEVASGDDTPVLTEADEAALAAEFEELGLSESSAKVAVKGR